MKVLIIGAGGQGGACASILAGFDAVGEIRLADLSEETVLSVKNQVPAGREKIVTATVDALSSDAVGELAAGVDVVIDMVLPWMAPYVMKGALAAGAHYINTAFDTPYWDEFMSGKSPPELTLSREFREAGLTALFGCGFAPGWTNVLARRFANRLDLVDGIQMRIGKATCLPGERPYDWVLRPWNPGWSPKQALIDCASPSCALENGEFVRYKPFSGLEMCVFPDPVGKLPVTHHSHEEVYSMATTFDGVRNIDFKYYLMYQPAILYTLGLCSDEKIEVGDCRVSPIDVVSALMPSPIAGVFGQSGEQLEYADRTSFIELIVRVSGVKDGKPVTWQANCPKMNAPGPELKRLFGTALVYVALPLSIGTLMLGDTEMKKGIIFADEIDPEAFIGRMLATGYPYRWDETKTEENDNGEGGNETGV
jgi:saccharopine dehydrogenase (NAD+, L-lysine-forming)